ncbi:MAG: hypothetical protein ACM3TN_27040 [Alphaproteobacteria bacterium]
MKGRKLAGLYDAVNGGVKSAPAVCSGSGTRAGTRALWFSAGVNVAAERAAGAFPRLSIEARGGLIFLGNLLS